MKLTVWSLMLLANEVTCWVLSICMFGGRVFVRLAIVWADLAVSLTENSMYETVLSWPVML